MQEGVQFKNTTKESMCFDSAKCQENGGQTPKNHTGKMSTVSMNRIDFIRREDLRPRLIYYMIIPFALPGASGHI